VVDFLPRRWMFPPVEGHDSDDEVELRRASDEEPFSALAFKIMSDPFVGHVTPTFAFIPAFSKAWQLRYTTHEVNA